MNIAYIPTSRTTFLFLSQDFETVHVFHIIVFIFLINKYSILAEVIRELVQNSFRSYCVTVFELLDYLPRRGFIKHSLLFSFQSNWFIITLTKVFIYIFFLLLRLSYFILMYIYDSYGFFCS